MNNKSSSMLLLFTFVAVVLGGTTGYFLPEFMLSISFIGKLFLNGLKIVAIPFAITMIIAGVASMGSKEKIKRALGKTWLYFAATSLTASLLGVLITLGIQPGVGAVKEGAHFPDEIVPYLNEFSFNNLFSSFIPENFLSASVELQLFALVVFAFLLGTVLTSVDKKNRIVLDFFLSLKEMFSGLMKYVFYAAPIGLFSLTGTLYAQNWQNAEMLFSSMALFTITIMFGLSFFALVLLPIVVKIFGNVSPYKYFTSMIPALSTAFATNSAAATLPITEECISKTDVDQRASAFMLPLGAIFNASGTALFLSAATIFIAQMYGLSITVGQILVIIGGSFFIASITSFIPYASLFMLALVLDIANFPIHVTAGIGLLVLVDFLFGRIRSVVDVWSDAVGVAILGNTFDFKTARSAKAAIPVKRTYTKTKTSRTSHSAKPDYPKTKRENKVSTQTKPAAVRKKTKEVVNKETVSPFQISPDTNSFAETEKKVEAVSKPKVAPKKLKTPVVKHEIKVPKIPQKAAKKETEKITKTTTKTQPKQERTKPIIHKIEVPPLPIIHKIEVPPLPIVHKIEVPPLPIVRKPIEKKVSPVEIKQDKEPVVTKANPILSQDTIARERAKITAQLNLMREKESKIDFSSDVVQEDVTPLVVKTDEVKKEDQFTKIDFYSNDESITETKSVEPAAAVEVVEKIEPVKVVEKVEKFEPVEVIETVEPIQAQQTTEVTANIEETAVLTPVKIVQETQEPEKIVEEPSTDPVEEKVTVSYGRKSSKKTAVKSAETDSAEVKSEPETKTIPKSEYAVESISFGRGKKKK